MKKALMFASVASMIDLFNMDNIKVLEDLGYTVDVACNFENGSITSQERVKEFRKELEEKGIKTYHIPVPRDISSISSMIISYRLLTNLLKVNDYNMVHCHSPIGGVIARLACKKIKKKVQTIIYTAHGFHFYNGAPKLNWILFYPIEKYFAKYTDILITINKEDYIRAKNFKAKVVEYVPGIGVDINEMQFSKAERNEIRESFGVQQDDFLLFSTGQLSKRKNHEIIINALANVKSTNVKYLICGLGELDTYLKNLAIDLGIEDRVIFAGYRKDVKKLIHIADCFVFPSLQEGLPVALMEGMAAGLPVICTEIRGNTDLIENGKGGYLLKYNNVDGFVEKIDYLNENLVMRKKMKKYNKLNIENFHIKKVNSAMKNIYLKEI